MPMHAACRVAPNPSNKRAVNLLTDAFSERINFAVKRLNQKLCHLLCLKLQNCLPFFCLKTRGKSVFCVEKFTFCRTSL